MFWIYALVGTAGLVAIVPAILRAIDGHDSDFVTGLIGFAGTAFGAVGILLVFTGLRPALTFSLAALFAVVVGALHRELLGELGADQTTHDEV